MRYEDRQQARGRILQLEDRIRSMEHAAYCVACRQAKAEFPHRTRPQFKIGGSSETQQLRHAFNRHMTAEMRKRQPLIDKINRKIARIRRFYGFND